MASTTSYETLLKRATDEITVDEQLRWDITERVTNEKSEGANQIVQAASVRWAFPDNGVKSRLLDLFDTLITETAGTVYKAMQDQGWLASLNATDDPEVRAIVEPHLKKWQDETGAAGTVAVAGGDGEPSQRGARGAGQFKTHLIKPLANFLSLAFLQAHALINRSRRSPYYPFQSLHLSKQILHLIILLNDDVPDDGPDDDHFDAGIELEDQLMEFEEKLEEWTKSPSDDFKEEIEEQYRIFYSPRFYFSSTRLPEQDEIWKRLVKYDEREIRYKQRYDNLVVTTEQSEDEEDRIERVSSGRASPAADPPAADKEEEPAKEDPGEGPSEPLSKVDVVLDKPEEEEKKEGEEVVASTADQAAIQAVLDDDEQKQQEEAAKEAAKEAAAEAAGDAESVERLRQFHDKQRDEPAEQTFNCPVPGCDRSFDKHYLLKHHIREHDDRPYTCPVDNCPRTFSSPIEQRRHEALHRIEKLGVLTGRYSASALSWPTAGRSNAGASTSGAGTSGSPAPSAAAAGAKEPPPPAATPPAAGAPTTAPSTAPPPASPEQK